ncbi:hypothetical protein Ahy_B08g090207 [Arachis hypogaea]|uniref:FAR1 domain-containing protein n=1 Tax=Arachis hypogaea TaxID=3818 RepID=A0A444XZQ4_ARAHY|nr:hypothetical protein Ahy_B08g090207 [Arachis hypogaea]
MDLQLPDHTGIPIEEIPYEGLRFDSLQKAQEFYCNYAKKLGFVTRIRNTNFDKTRKESKIPINQSIHFSHEGYRESRVKAATRNNDEADIQPNKTYLTLANEVGGSLKLSYSEKDVRNYITSNLHGCQGNVRHL